MIKKCWFDFILGFYELFLTIKEAIGYGTDQDSIIRLKTWNIFGWHYLTNFRMISSLILGLWLKVSVLGPIFIFLFRHHLISNYFSEISYTKNSRALRTPSFATFFIFVMYVKHFIRGWQMLYFLDYFWKHGHIFRTLLRRCILITVLSSI